MVQVAGSVESDIQVFRNDKITVDEIRRLNPSHIILSPGPGYPKDAGVCEDVVKELKGEYPILGVCLGHQAICEVFGADITHAVKLMHGKQSQVTVDTSCKLFDGLPKELAVARYHSLVASNLPEDLIVTSTDTENGEVMAVKHKITKFMDFNFIPSPY